MSEEGLCGQKSFDDICEVESSEYQRGYADGIINSKLSDGPGLIAFNEGAHLGHHRGVALGLQIGIFSDSHCAIILV